MLVKNFIANNICNPNKQPYQKAHPKKHFCSCSLAASFGGKHICLKLYIYFKDEEERLLFFAKRRKKKITISEQILERTSKLPPFNCKGSKKKKKENFVLLEGHSQILLEATCPPHFCILFLNLFCFLGFFCCCYNCAFFKIKYVRKIHI